MIAEPPAVTRCNRCNARKESPGPCPRCACPEFRNLTEAQEAAERHAAGLLFHPGDMTPWPAK